MWNNKKKTKEFPKYFIVDDKAITEKFYISEGFNRFFTDIGSNLASSINTEGLPPFQSYLPDKKPFRFKFNLINDSNVSDIINGFIPKSSSGYDDVSMRILKHIKSAIIPSITIIINQSLTTGIFLEHLKIAKVIPLYKKIIRKII